MKGFYLLGGALIALAAAPAFAQGPAEGTADAAEGNADIVVTASKLGALNRAPVSATEVTGEILTKANVQDLSGIAQRVPSLVYTTPTNNAQAFIRGIGSNFAQIGLESSVATYVDGVYLESQNGAAISTLDIANVQVLKGPQGTLYGRNATAGAIVATTNDPVQKFDGMVAAQAGRYGNVLVEGMLNVPLSDTLAFRVAARQTNNPAWRRFDPSIGGKAGAASNTTVRAKLGWKPGSDFDAVLSFEYGSLASNTYFAHQRLKAPLCAACQIYGVNPSDNFYDVTAGNEPKSTVQYNQTTLRLSYTGDSFDITSIFGYRHQNAKFYNEQDHTIAPLLDAYVFATADTFTNDTYARTHFSGMLNFLVGFSYVYDKSSQWSYLFGDQFGPLVGVVNNNYTKLYSLSGYAEAYVNFTPEIRLTGGVRYTRDVKTIQSVADTAAQLAFGQGDFSGRRVFPQTTPRAVLSYDGDLGYYYISYNRGVKSGGWSTPTFSTASMDPVGAESLDSFEIGAKRSFGPVRISLAAFYGKYSNIQVQHIDGVSGGPVFQNAASGKVKGVEGDIDWRVSSALNLSGGFTYLGSHFDSFHDAAVTVIAPDGQSLTGGQEDLSGTRLPRSPRWSGYLTGDLTVPVSGDWTGRLSVTGRYTGEFDFLAGAGGPLRLDRQPEYLKLDANFAVTDPSQKTEVSVFVQNITNHKYFEYAATGTTGAFYTPAYPITFGGRVSRKF